MDKEKEYADLGWANGWQEWPDIAVACRENKHVTVEKPVRRFVYEVICHICRYKYKYDSS